MVLKRSLSHILEYKYSQRYGKYRAVLALISEKKEVVWLTEKQLINMLDCFDQTPKGYSTKLRTVYGHWNERGYYAFTSVDKAKREFIAPEQHDLSDLLEVD